MMKRYDILAESGGCCPVPDLEPCDWGEWVRLEDAEKIQAECEALQREVSNLQASNALRERELEAACDRGDEFRKRVGELEELIRSYRNPWVDNTLNWSQEDFWTRRAELFASVQ